MTRAQSPSLQVSQAHLCPGPGPPHGRPCVSPLALPISFLGLIFIQSTPVSCLTSLADPCPFWTFIRVILALLSHTLLSLSFISNSHFTLLCPAAFYSATHITRSLLAKFCPLNAPPPTSSDFSGASGSYPYLWGAVLTTPTLRVSLTLI